MFGVKAMLIHPLYLVHDGENRKRLQPLLGRWLNYPTGAYLENGLLSPPTRPGIIARLFSIATLVKLLPKHSNSYFIIERMENLNSLNPAQIVVYATQYCSDCLRAKAFFEANSLAYIPVSLEGNPDATEFVMKMNHGYRSVPTIVFPDGTVLVEPSWQELKDKVLK